MPLSDETLGVMELPLTDRLALNRTVLANERTLLAYVRTAMMLAVSGFTLIQVFPGEWAAQIPGWCSLLAALIVCAIGVWRFLHVASSLQSMNRADCGRGANRPDAAIGKKM